MARQKYGMHVGTYENRAATGRERYPNAELAPLDYRSLPVAARLHPRKAPHLCRAGGSLRVGYSGNTPMRTNIVIDDKLMRETLLATGLSSKREAVDQALRTLLRLTRQAKTRQFRGKLDWQGDLNAMRGDR